MLLLDGVRLMHFELSKNRDPFRKCLTSSEWNGNSQIIYSRCFRISPVVCTVPTQGQTASMSLDIDCSVQREVTSSPANYCLALIACINMRVEQTIKQESGGEDLRTALKFRVP